MMRALRENTKWIMLITATAFVALMVFEWGMDMSGGGVDGVGGGAELGRVNGTSIGYGEWTETYRTLYQQRQEQAGPISSAENRELEDQAFEQLVMDRLIQQELRRRGIRVTDAEVQQAARFMPPPEFYNNEMFQTDGQFDLDRYHRFLSSGQADPQLLRDLERYYRQMLPRNKLFQQVAASVVVTDGELWHQYREQHETATIRYLRLDPQILVPEEGVTIADRDIAAYYREHRTQFERPARAQVRVVAVDKAPTAEDTAATRERAMELRQEILGGADFAEVARRDSDDLGTANRGGALGTIRRGQTVPVFEGAVWAARIGQVTEPVLSDYGYHLIRVDSRTQEEAEVSHILVEVELTLDSEDRMLSRVDSLEALVSRMQIGAAAQELGLEARTAQLTPLIPTVSGVGRVDEGVDWVFQERPSPGAISDIFENERYFYVMELVTREDARTLTLDEATPTIRSILIRQRQREETRDMGRQVMDRIRGGADMASAGAPLGVEPRAAGPFTRLDFVPGVGQANAAVGAAFGLGIGEISGLVATPEAFFILRVTERDEADEDAWRAQLPFQRQQVMGFLQNQRINQYLEALREEALVEDRRDRVLQRGPA